MIDKSILFKNFPKKAKEFKNNLNKTKKTFENFKLSLKNFELPLLESFDENYQLNFSKKTIKKFSRYKNIIIVGMGGSILGSKSIYSFFKEKIKKKVFFFDNLDSNLNFEFKKIKNLKSSCFIIISKSGNTLETIANLGAIFSKTLLKNKLIFITEIKDNYLMNIANQYGAEVIEHEDFIGGRYSVLSEAGMFPAALMGLKLNKFKNFSKLLSNKKFISYLIQNVAGIYTLNSRGYKNSVILNYDSNLNDLGYWYQQLIAESLGKKGKGIMPIISQAPRDHHSVFQLFLDGPQDKFFTFFSSSKKNKNYIVSKKIISNTAKFIRKKNINSIVQAQCTATKNVFSKQGIPFRHLILKKKDEEELGAVFTFFVLETILLGQMMKINPFNQPAVEKIKMETKKILSR